MGVMESVRATEEAGRLVITPSPVLLDGQKNVAADLIPGESLYSFLSRHVDPSEPWEVRIGGVVVPVEMWAHVKPKHGQIIEVRGAVNRQAVALVAMVALTYFTFGAGSIVGLGGAYAGAGAYVAATGLYMAGSMLINKVLTPELPKPKADSRDSVYSIGAARNSARPYEPIALLLGHTRITPDYASAPYTWYEGDDMYLGMVLNVGINVQDVGEIYNADTVLTSYEGVQVYYSGIPGKPNQAIPLYSNADTIDGGALEKSTAWVQRTTPPDTVRVQVNIEGSIGDKDSKGRDYRNSETIQAQYRPVGTTTWLTLTSRVISNDNDKNFEVQRVTMSRDLPRGQYEVRVRRLYTAGDPDKGNWSAASEFQWTNMVAVQADEADYAGMGRIGIRVKATGQLTGAMDQLRLEAWSRPVPVWTGSAWVTESTSNPGALALQFLRGIKDENGKLIAGVGLTDAEIDIPSLQAFMVHCEAEGYTYDHYLTETRSNGDQLDAILRAGFGALSWETGKLGVVWAADGQPVSGVVNMATIKKGQFQVDYTLHNAADGIEATYFDRTDWSVKTLRVAAPGVTTMLNPAQVQLEGVTSEEHAAQLARWHLAQSLYQYKDITYSTDLEHLAYKRMDVLQLQHDLTQWGYGGRLVSVSGSTVTLDEPVPPSATAHIGIRIPGEAVYRIMRVANFTGDPRDTVTLLDAWPSDAPLPTAENAHDYIWIYDFKATPGYRVRVVGKTLESDAKGASVAVVPESPEFWTYVKTGEYTPPKGGSLLNTLPKASNVRVSEVQVVTGDVIHTELSVLFDIKGQAARSVIFAGISGTEIRPVAETVTNQVRFRIGSAGTYTILVRPYNSEGIAGQSASTTYTTTGADIPPPPFDWFTVTVEPGGLRRYAWGYNQFQPADLAGAEIRFAPGTTAPAWDAMTPLGEDGFFTAAFESDIPESGQWVFSIRARNTSGELSSRISTTLNLTANVGENLEDHEDRISTTEQVAQEILSDFADMNQQIADVQAEAQQAAAALNLRADQLRDDIDATMAQLNDILGAEEWDAGTAYAEGDLVQLDGKLYRALQAVPAGTPVSNTAYWEQLGEYASLGDAVAAALSQLSSHADELLAHAESLNLLGAKNGAGTAWLLDMDTVRVSASETMAQWRSSLQASFDDANARIDAEETARADGDAALASTLATVQATADNAATKAELTSAQNALAAADQALSERIDLTQASIGGVVTVANPSFESDTGWGDTPGSDTLPAGAQYVWSQTSARRSGNYSLSMTAGVSVFNSRIVATQAGDVFYVAAWARSLAAAVPDAGSVARVGMRAYDADGEFIDGSHQAFNVAVSPGVNFGWTYGGGEYTVPDTAVGVSVYLAVSTSTGAGTWLIDDVTIDRVTQTDRALASLLNSTRADVQTNATGIAANTSQIAAQSVAIVAADTKATNAQSAAQAASDLAGGKGKVFFQNTAPAAADRQPQNLWIDTTGGANTPKRWVSGSTWSPVTDKAATDAAAAASAAMTAAQNAQTTATAAANAVASTNLTVAQHGTTLTAHGTQLSGLTASVGDAEASINELREVSASSADVVVLDAGFEEMTGWGSSPTNNTLPAGARYVLSTTSAVRSGQRSLGMLADTIVYNTRMSPAASGDRFSMRLWARSLTSAVPPSGSGMEIGMRAYDAAGNFISGSNTSYVVVTSPGSNFGWTVGSAEYVAPAGTVYVSAYLRTRADTGSGEWLVDDVRVERISTTLESVLARYSLAVQAGGDIAGIQLLAGGGISAIRFLADNFSVVNPGGTSGLTWEGGTLWNKRGGYSMLAGPNLGENMLFYIGPTPASPGAATKANAMFYVDSSGTGYFAGQVLQGVLRNFNSNTTVSATASVSTGSVSSNNRSVQVTGKFQYQRQQIYPGTSSIVTLGSGSTQATVVLERRYGSGSWTEIGRQTIPGIDTVAGSNGVDPSTVMQTISGEVFATDSADPRAREYRTRVLTRTVRSHSVTNPGTTPPPTESQYQSIESME